MPCPNCFGLLPGERDTGSTAPRYCQCYPTYPQPLYRPPIEQLGDRPTLRDEFAMAAMSGLISVSYKLFSIPNDGDVLQSNPRINKMIIDTALSIADAMLAERNGGNG